MTQRTCTHPDCNKPYRARGLCGTHYNQMRDKETPGWRHPKVEQPCTVCGKPIIKEKTNIRRPVCSYDCRYELVYGISKAEKDRAYRDARQVDRPAPKWYRALLDRLSTSGSRTEAKARFIYTECQWCSEQFIFDRCVSGVPAKYCDRRCSRSAERHRRSMRDARQGKMAYRSKIIHNRIRMRIYERDNWTCQICGEPTSHEYDPHDMYSPTLDHIVPQSLQLFPDHSPTNLRLAHMICNSERGNRVD